MSNGGNENNDVFWAPEHVVHSQQNQQQFIAPDGSLPAASNSYFNPNATGEPHGMNYGHPPPGDNFTVLSDGFGNFIKVYHQPSEDVNLNNPAGKYEYELFSSNNSYMRPAPGFGFLFPPQQQQPQQQPSVPKVTNASHMQHNAQADVPGSNTSMLINQLVGNWAPTISGTYSPFGGGGPSLLAEGLPRSSEAYAQQHEQPQKQQQQQQSAQQLLQQQQHHVHQQQQPQQAQPSPVHQSVSNSSMNSSQSQPQHQAPVANVSATASYNNQLNDDNSAKLNQNVKKQRIVAEVKPMRMSYSDVLSKNVPSSNAAHSSLSPGTSTMNGSTSIGTANNSVASGKTNTANNGMHSGGNGYSSSGNGKSNKDKLQNKKSSMQHGGLATSDEKSNRKVDRNAVLGVQKKTAYSNVSNPSNNYQHADNSTVHKTTIGQNVADKSSKKTDKPVSKTLKSRLNESSGLASVGRKNRSRNFNDAYTVQDVQGNASNKESTRDDTEDLDDEDDEDDEEDEEDSEEYEDDSPQQQSYMYNVKKNNNPNDTHIERISGSRSTYKRGGKASAAGRGKLEKSYPQSTGKRGQKPKKNQKYVMIQKILNTWFELMVFAITWLWSLVSDVVYLSFRLCWDYLVAGYQYCEQHFVSIKQEFQQNRPGTWFKGIWKSFDNRFATDSKWAFWRGKKKSMPVEEQPPPGKNYYKDGRLPTTADEAMSSLLNCKGKDAYSILGVSPDCSQEQIRKHYKKIAVLVHPDKNKQPGAEEAFKVLQRSFELIGEPENRKSYNQSLAEALNAEKAWSEINDLLTQLHTKISEAANTIRCSSCCLRHPRKPTGRPHYAARECNSCKIRHSAREGDIWAETSLFGLRWKYLAMMEGNVYDITEWANCQKGALSHLQPNSHIVQYRIVLGGNSQQQQQQGNQQQPDKDPGRSRKDVPSSEPNLDDFLNNIYGGQNQQQQQQAQGGTRRRHRRN
ncbi:uncharacterized protein DDB_G0283357 [Armigeres subalbatus]|uniref:uncharacterized protein DDB_G0283357 n=1 Tax=Armigeres subalbatus TaxID=124917 RepID=UPI002ED34EA2